MAAFLDELITLPMPILLIMLSGVACWRLKGVSRGLFAAATGLFFVLSVPVAGEVLQGPLLCANAPESAIEAMHPAAIVVPTAGVFEDGAGSWWASSTSIRRMAAGLKAQDRHGLPLILVGGNPVEGHPAEAGVIGRQFQLAGRKVIMEETARNSFETGGAVARIMRDMPSSRVVLITSDIHAARMAASLRHAGIEVAPVPVGNPGSQFAGWTDFLPSHRGLSISNAAIREYAAILWYVATGRFGWRDLIA